MNHHRRGAVAAAMVAALVIMGLVVVGFVVMTAGDSDLTVKRADAMRTFYAADSGINMSVRELLTNTDCDGDGTIGSVSSDGNGANDPSIGGARVSVALTTSGGTAALSSSARGGTAWRKVAGTAESLAGGARWMLYCDWPNATPTVSQWNGRGWGTPKPTLDVGSKIYWALLKRCSSRIELMAAASNNAREIYLMIFNGTAWSDKILCTTDDGDRDHRPFYIAYERTGGDGLAVYRKQNNSGLYYRVWNGSAWAAEGALGTPFSGVPVFVKLMPRPGSSEIMLLAADDHDDLFASVWNGSAWGNSVTLETSLASHDSECFDMSYETAAGRCMVVWGRAADTQPNYRIWDGSSWLSAGTVPTVGGVPLWVRTSPSPTGNRIALAVADDVSDVNVNVWSGSAWGADAELAASASTIATRPVDIAWEPDGARALCAYTNGGQQTPYYNLWNGTFWGPQQTGPPLPGTPLLVQLEPSLLGKEILLSSVISGGQSALTWLRWNGASFSNYTLLEDNVSGPTPKEVFMLSDAPPGAVGGSARLNGWTEAAP